VVLVAYIVGVEDSIMSIPDMQHRIIAQWMQDVVVNEGYRRFDDLHIDDVDPRYEDPRLWMPGITAALNEAVSIRDLHNWPFTVAAGISLMSSEIAQGPAIRNPDDVVQQIDETPPSLYVFPKGGEPWHTQQQSYTKMPDGAVTTDSRACCYFSEQFDSTDQEYRRVVWISR
jgi:hypothetical protein